MILYELTSTYRVYI